MTNKWFGWSGTILEVDLTSQTVRKKELPQYLAFNYLGQSGTNARLLYEMVPPGINPYDPITPLIFGVGPLAGTLAPSNKKATRR